MQTLTEIVAAVVMHSSAVAYSHFGVTLEPQKTETPPPAERSVARTAPKPVVARRAPVRASDKVADCPDGRSRTLRT